MVGFGCGGKFTTPPFKLHPCLVACPRDAARVAVALRVFSEGVGCAMRVQRVGFGPSHSRKPALARLCAGPAWMSMAGIFLMMPMAFKGCQECNFSPAYMDYLSHLPPIPCRNDLAVVAETKFRVLGRAAELVSIKAVSLARIFKPGKETTTL